MTTHLTYAPPVGQTNPITSALWYPGIPAANYVESVDANATIYIARGLYTGTVGTEPLAHGESVESESIPAMSPAPPVEEVPHGGTS